MTQATATSVDQERVPTKITLRAWPKMLFLWPSALISLVTGIMTYLAPENVQRIEFWGTLFLVIFAINLFIITFEFPRSTSLILILACVAITWILVELNRRYNIIVPLTNFVENLRLTATADFYFTIFFIYLILAIGMLISTRFNYWEISSNELLHHKGLMQDVERFSTDGLQYSKEITDFFEHLIGGSGRLVLRSPSIERSVTLENVLGINRVAHNLDLMLEYRRVAVNNTPVVQAVDPNEQNA